MDLGLIGLWVGLGCGLFVSASLQVLYILSKLDWQLESTKAKERAATAAGGSANSASEAGENDGLLLASSGKVDEEE